MAIAVGNVALGEKSDEAAAVYFSSILAVTPVKDTAATSMNTWTPRNDTTRRFLGMVPSPRFSG
jgi:hypothetical protein